MADDDFIEVANLQEFSLDGIPYSHSFVIVADNGNFLAFPFSQEGMEVGTSISNFEA